MMLQVCYLVHADRSAVSEMKCYTKKRLSKLSFIVDVQDGNTRKRWRSTAVLRGCITAWRKRIEILEGKERLFCVCGCVVCVGVLCVCVCVCVVCV